jgi:hypothetical protein
MTQVHTIARDSAPSSATSTRKALNPKTVTVFLDAGPSGNKRAAHAVALAQRWDAHLVGVHVVFTSEALHPCDSYAIGERAIKQVIAHEKKVRADDEEVASQVGNNLLISAQDRTSAANFVGSAGCSRPRTRSSMRCIPIW